MHAYFRNNAYLKVSQFWFSLFHVYFRAMLIFKQALIMASRNLRGFVDDNSSSLSILRNTLYIQSQFLSISNIEKKQKVFVSKMEEMSELHFCSNL